MKIKIWIKSTDGGDGSHYFRVYPTEEQAREGVDDDDLDECGYPVEVDDLIVDVADFEVVED